MSVLLAVGEGDRRLEPDDRNPELGDLAVERGVVLGQAMERGAESLDVQALAIGAPGQDDHPQAEPLERLDRRHRDLRLVVGREGVLSEQHRALLVCVRELPEP